MKAGYATLLVAAVAVTPAFAGVYGPCKFDSQTLRFGGTVDQTAACLLKKVRMKGAGADPQPVPEWLRERMAQPIDLTIAQWSKYLEGKGLSEADIGGRVVAGSTPGRRYFVIHDTSSPELANASQFPVEIDDPTYAGNSLLGWTNLTQRVNVIVSRDGRSRTFQPWGATRAKPALKLEQDTVVPRARDVFVHVENVQPRIKPTGSWAWKAPVPGFSPRQEERLALAYIAASLSAGYWLLPAFHFNVDEGFSDGHDDPQNADLASWVARLSVLEQEIRSVPRA